MTEKSLADQFTELEPLAKREGLLVVKRWEESKSAKIPHLREHWSELIRMVEKGKIDGIICWHINRLVRNMEEGGKLVQLFVEGKVKQIRTPHATYKTGDNILPLVIEAATATQYSIDLSNRVIVGQAGNFRLGGCNYKGPHGYRNERHPLDLKKGIIVTDGERFILVRKAWDMLFTGAYTPAQITDTLNNVWLFRSKPTKKKPSKPLSYSTLYKMFRNPFYAGFVRYKGQIVKGSHEPMVTAAEFNYAQQILGDNPYQKPSLGTEPFAFTGLMHCAYCGHQVTAERKVIKSHGRTWENYHCADPKRQCTKHGMSRDKVEEKIIKALESITIDPELCQAALENIMRDLDSQAGKVLGLYSQQNNTLEGIEARLGNLADMWISGLMTDPDVYRQKEEQLKGEKSRAIMNAEGYRLDLETMRANAMAVANYIIFARDHFMASSPERKREIAHWLGIKYNFYGREKEIRVEVHPLLMEVVKYARKIEQKSQPLEPEENGSTKGKARALTPAFSSGGPEGRQLELTDTLLQALRECHFHHFDFA